MLHSSSSDSDLLKFALYGLKISMLKMALASAVRSHKLRD